MALVRWKDKAQLSTLTGNEKLPITDANNVDKYVTADTIASLNDAAITSVATTANTASSNATTALSTANSALAATQAFELLVLQSGGWDAATNTPTLANGTGVSNQAYIITVGGTRNLGAGSVTYIAGYTLYYAGGVWSQALLANTSTLDSVSDGSNRKAVTANQRLGLDNSTNAITSSNPVVSLNELNTRISAVEVSSAGQDNYIQNYEVDGYISGTGLLRSLAGLGYSTAQIRAKFPRMYYVYGDVSTSLSYDTAVIREAILSLGYGNQTYVTSITDRKYIVNDQIIIPSIKLDVAASDREHSQQRIIDFKGCRINDVRTSTSSTPLFIKEPTNETSAANNDLELSLRFANADIYGEDIASLPYANSVCMKIGAAKRFELDNVVIHNYDIGLYGSLLLNSFITKSEFINCITSGVKTSTGWWSGATASRSPSQLTFINTRFKDAGAKYCDLTNCDTSSFIGNNQFEGNGGDYAIYWDNQNTSVIKNLTVTNLRVEQESKFARAILGIKSGDGFSASLSKVFHQAATSGTVLVEAESVGGGDTRIDIEKCYNSGGATAWKLRNIGANCWDIKQTILQGQPANETQLLSGIVPYDNIWDLTNGGSIPTSNRVNFIQRLPKV